MKSKLTPAQVDGIESFAEKGKSSSWIASRFDLHEGAVAYRMLRAGFDPWPGQRMRDHLAGAFSPQEDQRLLELALQGVNTLAIARILRRPYTSVRVRLMVLEVRAENALGTTTQVVRCERHEADL